MNKVVCIIGICIQPIAKSLAGDFAEKEK